MSTTYRVLLVEDSDTDVFLITTLLKKSIQSGVRCELDRARSLGEALRHLELNTVDIVLLDLGLPDSDSLDGVRAICRGNSQVPVVVLTGLDDDEIAVHAVRA